MADVLYIARYTDVMTNNLTNYVYKNILLE